MIQCVSIRRSGQVITTREHLPRATRSIRAVILDHLARRARGDIEGDIRDNYAPDVLVLSPRGGRHGADGVRHCDADLASALGPDACLDYEQLWIDGPIGYLEWTASGPWTDRRHGAESLVVSEGRIIAQIMHYEASAVENAGGKR